MARLRLERSNRHTVEVIADYLRELWRFGLKDIQHAVGESRLSSTKLELVVTLPAIWPLYARLRMREAVDLAGILKFREAGPTGLSFISKPEAAALATVEDFAGRIDLKVRSTCRPTRVTSNMPRKTITLWSAMLEGGRW